MGQLYGYLIYDTEAEAEAAQVEIAKRVGILDAAGNPIDSGTTRYADIITHRGRAGKFILVNEGVPFWQVIGTGTDIDGNSFDIYASSREANLTDIDAALTQRERNTRTSRETLESEGAFDTGDNP